MTWTLSELFMVMLATSAHILPWIRGINSIHTEGNMNVRPSNSLFAKNEQK